MKRRSQVAMSEQEVRAFLVEDGYTLQLATLGADGFPHLAAMWYAVVDGCICFNTYLTSQKGRNLGRDHRVTCMVERGEQYAELRGVVVQGHADLIDATDEIRRISAEIGARYPSPETSGGSTPSLPRQRMVYRVRPVNVYSWDHRKLPRGVH